MRFNFGCFFALVSVVLFTGCSRNDNPPSPPTNPPPVSTDSAVSHWTEIKTGNDTVTYSDVYFIDSVHGFATASNRLLYTSKDGGLTWQIVPGIKSNRLFERFYFLNAQQGYCIGTGELAITMDGGESWTTKPLPSNIISAQQIWINIQFITPSIGYITTAVGLYKTTDTGTVWTRMYPKLSNGLYFTDASSGILYTGPDSLYRTTDGGEHWQPFSAIPTANKVEYDLFNVFQFTDMQHGWLMDNLTLNASSDGGYNWTKLSMAVPTDSTFFTNFKMFDNQTGYLLTPMQIMKTTDGGKSWQQEYKLSSGTLVGLFYLDENHRWVGCANGVMLKYHP